MGNFVWVDDYPASNRSTVREYVITPGDLLAIRVYNQEGMSGRPRVRADGKISLPFLNDVQAAGLTTTALADSVASRLKDFVVNPIVSVSLEEARPFEVYVVGQVARPGRYAMDASGTVLQGIAAAGGLTAFAARDRIFVVRNEPSPVRIRFRYEALSKLEERAATFLLQNGDTIVVE
jgi:polysaccharide export outer membrane protein